MYEKYFGFNTLPFSITPDPAFFYDNPSCREAMAALRYGIEGRKGFIVISGEPGTGKTRLVKDFIQRAEVTIRTALVTAPKTTASQLVRLVLNELGIAPSTHDLGALTLQLKDYLFEQFKKHHMVALLVDEAQHLSNELLEDLRLLSNLETNEEKLIQIVLVGQPELEERLNQPELRQLRQRIALRCRLVRLKDEEVYLYIQARLKTAGFKEKALFEPKAVEKIALYSNGIPRLINVICDSALLNAFALSKKNISAEIIEEVARDLQFIVRRPKDKLIANPQAAVENDQRIIGDEGRWTAESQRPLAEEFQDVFMAETQRSTGVHPRRSLATLATGFLVGVLVAAGLVGIFNSQSNSYYLSQIGARIWDQINWREIVNTGGSKPVPLQIDQSKELKDVQLLASEKAPVSTQQQEATSGDANATTSLEASKGGPFQPADTPDRSQEKQPVKIDKKNQETIKTATTGTSNNVVDVDRTSASDRLVFEIYKAIANRAITGVEVSVIDGTVFLSGRVATENHKILAARAARNVPGVNYLRDQIIIKDDVAS